MFNKRKDAIASQDGLGPTEPTEGAEGGIRSRRQFLAHLSQAGASLVAGLSLAQAASAQGETAASANVASKAVADTTAISATAAKAGMRCTHGQTADILGNITTFTYSLDKGGRPGMVSSGTTGHAETVGAEADTVPQSGALSNRWVYVTESQKP